MWFAAALLLPQLVSGPPAGALRLPTPGVEYRTNIASATRKPTIVSNGVALEQGTDKIFFYDVPGAVAALAAAEAFSYSREAGIHTDAEGSAAFNRMLEYLRALPTGPVSPLPDNVRLFGSAVVMAHVTGDARRIRVHLLNYSGHPVRALRVLVPGRYPRAPEGVTEYDVSADATEFTVPQVDSYLAIDLIRAP